MSGVSVVLYPINLSLLLNKHIRSKEDKSAYKIDLSSSDRKPKGVE